MKVTCEHCGLPFSVARSVPGKAVYCCSGCALAARVPVDAQGQFPVNAALVTALGLGFVFFNQVLFWLLAVLLARSVDGAANAERFAWASLGVGTAVWIALAVFQGVAGARRITDLAVLAAAAGLLACGVTNLHPGLAAGGNALLAAWALRGLMRKRGA
jgi:hypothetical protein